MLSVSLDIEDIKDLWHKMDTKDRPDVRDFEAAICRAINIMLRHSESGDAIHLAWGDAMDDKYLIFFWVDSRAGRKRVNGDISIDRSVTRSMENVASCKKKITPGYVVQYYDEKNEQFITQYFRVSETSTWEDSDDNTIEKPESAPHMMYDMEQPTGRVDIQVSLRDTL